MRAVLRRELPGQHSFARGMAQMVTGGISLEFEAGWWFSLRLPTDTYAVDFNAWGDAVDPDLDLPQRLEQALVVADDRTDLALAPHEDIGGVRVRVAVRMNGEKPRVSGDCTDAAAGVHFTSKSSRFEIGAAVPCSSPEFSAELELPPGTYDAVVVGRPGSNLPPGSLLVAQALQIGAETTDLSLDLHPVRVAGVLHPTGSAAQLLSTCVDSRAGTIVFEQGVPLSGTYVFARIPCGTGARAWSLAVPAGEYRVVIEPNAGEGTGNRYVVAERLWIE